MTGLPSALQTGNYSGTRSSNTFPRDSFLLSFSFVLLTLYSVTLLSLRLEGSLPVFIDGEYFRPPDWFR